MSLLWRPMALEDRERILFHIAQDNPAVALETDERIEQQAERLLQFPRLGRSGRLPGTFELVVTRTPLLIVYRIVGDEVVILRVLHHAQQWPPAKASRP